MKLGVSYNVFEDSIELLEKSIESIRDKVDFISVIYQNVSNFGENSSDEYKSRLDDILYSGLVDFNFLYNPVVNSNPHQNEINKRQIGLNVSLNKKCTHHMSMDSDEFYTEESLDNIIEDLKNGVESGYAQMKTYYKEPFLQLSPPEEYYVSLFYKINKNTKYEFNCFTPVLVDPTRRIVNGNYKIYKRNEVEMHHMSYVRENIDLKLRNSSARVNFNQNMEKISNHYKNFKKGDKALLAGTDLRYYDLIEVDNIFNIQL